MHYIPGLSLRVTEEAEILGIDDAEMGEFAYDYVGLEQEIGHSVDTVGAVGGAREPDHQLQHHQEEIEKSARDKVTEIEVTDSSIDDARSEKLNVEAQWSVNFFFFFGNPFLSISLWKNVSLSLFFFFCTYISISIFVLELTHTIQISYLSRFPVSCLTPHCHRHCLSSHSDQRYDLPVIFSSFIFMCRKQILPRGVFSLQSP